MVSLWNGLRASQGLGPLGRAQVGQLCKAVADAWPVANHDQAVLERAIRAYHDDRELFTIRQGHSVGEFQRRIDHWVREGLGTTPRPSAPTLHRFAAQDAAKNAVKAAFLNGAASHDHHLITENDDDTNDIPE